jgi:GT2 family glycosyltransferase
MQGAGKEYAELPYTKDIIRNWSAVTAACLMVEKRKFQLVGGFDEELQIALNDVDFCLKLMKKKFRNIYTPYVELYHHESISVGRPESLQRDKILNKKEIQIFNKRWEKMSKKDTLFNENYSLYSSELRIKKIFKCLN